MAPSGRPKERTNAQAPASRPPTLYAFGDFELDGPRFELRRAGEKVRIEPKVLDLLLVLVRSRHRIVHKSEILDALWPGVTVSDASISARRPRGAPRARRRRAAHHRHRAGPRLPLRGKRRRVAPCRSRRADARADASGGARSRLRGPRGGDGRRGSAPDRSDGRARLPRLALGRGGHRQDANGGRDRANGSCPGRHRAHGACASGRRSPAAPALGRNRPQAHARPERRCVETARRRGRTAAARRRAEGARGPLRALRGLVAIVRRGVAPVPARDRDRRSARGGRALAAASRAARA